MPASARRNGSSQPVIWPGAVLGDTLETPTAIAILPDSATNGEAVFWTGISLAAAGKEREAGPYLARAYSIHPKWADLVPRLPAAGLLPQDPDLVSRLVARMKSERP
jgi:hypothetical protein